MPDSLAPAGQAVRHAVAAGSDWPAAVTRLVAIGPLALRLRFATPVLATQFAAAFALPLADAAVPGGADWELSVADGAAGVAAPALRPAGPGGESPGGDIPNGDMQLQDDATGHALWMGRHAPVLYAVDRVARRALYWVRDARQVPAWERSRPFLPILQAMLDDGPWIAVHGAALAWQDRAVLIAGAGHAGKTSLALAGRLAGWRFLGDDFVLLRTDGTPAVAPLFATARLRDDMVARFPALLAARREISEEDGERRHELDLPPGAAGPAALPLGLALLLDRRGAAAPVLQPVGRAALLAALAATTLVATPGRAPARTAKLLRLLALAGAPRRFDPGPDFAAALALLRGALA